ncbi:hypothetical protein ACKXGF_02810 [Alkalibacillus sp. S2W]|uniref:hypothetical protein n=1 Tax=Alkalibacillus sp. S2W TaxID=3386553 RepID=UPI00398D5446
MDIKTYLDNTEFATKQLFCLLFELVENKNNLIHLEGMAPLHLKDAKTFESFASQVKADGNDEESRYFFKKAYEKYHVYKEASSSIENIKNHYTDKISIANGPIQVISQAILQIAKQGLSFVYDTNIKNIEKKLTSPPRTILDKNGDSIKKFDKGNLGTKDINIIDVIWQGRNQSIHYEEGKMFQNVTDLFEPLMNSYDKLTGYDNYQNKAYEIVSIVLEWDSYESYRKDMEKIV